MNRLHARGGVPLRICTGANQEWALDFVHSGGASGRTIRVLSAEDAYARECLALEVDTSFANRRITRVLRRRSQRMGGRRRFPAKTERNSRAGICRLGQWKDESNYDTSRQGSRRS